MGDMADFALDCAMNDCEEYWSWVELGRNPHEGYELGILDELGREIEVPYVPSRVVRPTLPDGPGACPSCKGPTELKIGKFGPFYGCKNFPRCHGSRNFIGD